VTPAQVAPIVRALPPFVTPVGIFWDHPAGHVKQAVEACGLRALQFHGDERPEDLTGYTLPVIKTIKLPPAKVLAGFPEGRTDDVVRVAAYVGCVAAILLDSAERWSEGGLRHPIEWHLARRLRAGRCHLILSGGLTPQNVGAAIETVGPTRSTWLRVSRPRLAKDHTSCAASSARPSARCSCEVAARRPGHFGRFGGACPS
jgi:phosphoribosylanthranilate isomerase